MTSLAVALAIIGGLAGSVQVALMGRFGARVGTFEALAFSTIVQLVISGAILFAVRGGIGGLHNPRRRRRGCGSAASPARRSCSP